MLMALLLCCSCVRQMLLLWDTDKHIMRLLLLLLVY